MSKESSVGKRIQTYRTKLDMSVYDLAQKSGIDEKVINSIEKGQVLPALGVLTKLSRALGQRLGTFMDDQFKPDPIITRAKEEGRQGRDERPRLRLPLACVRQARSPHGSVPHRIRGKRGGRGLVP